MKLHTVNSGGQTGADRTGLEEAEALGIRTGGVAPKFWRTDEGPAPDLGTRFGLVQSHSGDYKPRTRQNVHNTDVTLWFGTTTSPGYYCTRTACKDYGREFYENPSELQLEYLCNSFEIWNIAGNRRSKNPAVVQLVKDAFATVHKLMDAAEQNHGPKTRTVESTT